MKTRTPSIERIGFQVGLITCICMIGYFFLMNLLNLEQMLELRFFNFVIMAVGICYGIRKLKLQMHGTEFYMRGWAQGLYISAVAVGLFALFMTLYLHYFDTALMDHIRENALSGQSINGLTIFITIIIEGMAGCSVIILAAMQYFKSPGTVKSETF